MKELGEIEEIKIAIKTMVGDDGLIEMEAIAVEAANTSGLSLIEAWKYILCRLNGRLATDLNRTPVILAMLECVDRNPKDLDICVVRNNEGSGFDLPKGRNQRQRRKDNRRSKNGRKGRTR